jgi:hypothetical protein
MLNDGYNVEKSCNCPKQSPLPMALARSTDPSVVGVDPPNSSNAPSSNGLESQPKMETE